MATSSGRLGFFRRFIARVVSVLASFHTALIAIYFFLRLLTGDSLWFVDVVDYVLPWLFVPSLLLLPAASLFRLSRPLLAIAAAPMALFLLVYGHLYLPRWPVRADGPAFTVLTHNVLYENQDVDALAASIEAHAPDFFGLRELSGPVADSLVPRLAARYPYHRLEPGCGFWSRYPILAYESFRLVEEQGAWAQSLVLDVEGRPVNVLSVHPRAPPVYGIPLSEVPGRLPTAFADGARDADLHGLLARLEGFEGPLVLIGDLNTTDRNVLYGPLTRRLRDAHRESGWGMGFTFAPRPEIDRPLWRIDYVLHSPDLVARSVRVGEYAGSDHRPLIARLAFRERYLCPNGHPQ